jgi:hypothetical protein
MRYYAELQQRYVQQMVALQKQREERENRERVAAWKASQAEQRRLRVTMSAPAVSEADVNVPEEAGYSSLDNQDMMGRARCGPANVC